MSNVAMPALRGIIFQRGKWAAVVAAFIVVVALMALSFAVGRTTMSKTANVIPANHPAAVVSQPVRLPEKACRFPGRC